MTIHASHCCAHKRELGLIEPIPPHATTTVTRLPGSDASSEKKKAAVASRMEPAQRTPRRGAEISVTISAGPVSSSPSSSSSPMIRRRLIRRRYKTCSRFHPRTILSAFLVSLIVCDYLSLMTTDDKQVTTFEKFVGVKPSLALTASMILHVVAFLGGVSKTVFGCRAALCISWFYFMLTLSVLLVTPAAVASLVASGYDPTVPRDTVVTSEPRTQKDLGDSFCLGFMWALAGQSLVFIFVVGYLVQISLCLELIQEAYQLEADRIAESEDRLRRGEREPLEPMGPLSPAPPV